ncbi:MAG: hypothetical protein ACRDQ5_10995 [Sciscionella sp.]
MLIWLFVAYATVALALIARAGLAAIQAPDSEQRKDAYRVLKLILGTASGAGGEVAVLVRLHELGLL